MNYWIIATIVICLFIWYIVKCWSKSFEIVNEGALAQEREAILEIIEQERPLEYSWFIGGNYSAFTNIFAFIIFGQKRRWREHFLWTYPCWISWKED